MDRHSNPNRTPPPHQFSGESGRGKDSEEVKQVLAPALERGPFEEKQPAVHKDEPRMNTNGREDRWTSFGATTSWDEAPRERGRPARTKPGTASAISSTRIDRQRRHVLCFGRAHAVPAGRVAGCRIAGKPSGRRRETACGRDARAPGRSSSHHSCPSRGRMPDCQAAAGADPADPSRFVSLRG